MSTSATIALRTVLPHRSSKASIHGAGNAAFGHAMRQPCLMTPANLQFPLEVSDGIMEEANQLRSVH
jgi:hypothetical protein